MGACASKQKKDSGSDVDGNDKKRKKSNDLSSTGSSTSATSPTGSAVTPTGSTLTAESSKKHKNKPRHSAKPHKSYHQQHPEDVPAGTVIPHSPVPDESFSSRVSDSVTISVIDSPSKETLPTFIAGPPTKKSTRFTDPIHMDGVSQTEPAQGIYDVNNYNIHDYREVLGDILLTLVKIL